MRLTGMRTVPRPNQWHGKTHGGESGRLLDVVRLGGLEFVEFDEADAGDGFHLA
jgi:hypothetical protein